MQRKLSEISSLAVSSQPATLTKEASLTCALPISSDTSSATSSRASADGRLRSELPDGPTLGQSGPDRAPANPAASRAVKKALQTSATFGLFGENLSPSDALQRSLESKLRLGLRGSPLCEVIWKPWSTPWGQSLWKPRARVGINSEIVIGLWPAATTPSGGQKNPPGTSLSGRRPDGTKATVTLQNVVLAVWSALRASDGAKGGPNMSFGAGGCPLPSQVSAIAKSSNVPMENGGLSLHPEFAGWEMRFPPEFLNCAFSEMPSIRSPRRSSSAPQHKVT
jgi:hypothetical protein